MEPASRRSSARPGSASTPARPATSPRRAATRPAAPSPGASAGPSRRSTPAIRSAASASRPSWPSSSASSSPTGPRSSPARTSSPTAERPPSLSDAMARPREFDEKTVVRAARDRFWNAGYAATSMSDLSAATGVGKTSLYGAFGDKHALYLRIFDEYSTRAVQDARERVADGPDEEALARIRAYLLDNARGSAGNPRG